MLIGVVLVQLVASVGFGLGLVLDLLGLVLDLFGVVLILELRAVHSLVD